MSAQSTMSEHTDAAYALLNWPRAGARWVPSYRHRVAASIAAPLAVILAAFTLGPLVTGGRFGLTPVGGDLASRHFAAGSCLFVAPGTIHEGDFVLARAVQNGAPAMTIRRLVDGRLVTDDGTMSSGECEVVGKVLGCLPAGKLALWGSDRDAAGASTGPATPASSWAAQAPQLLDAQLKSLRAEARVVEPRATYLKGYSYTGDTLQVTGGRKMARAAYILGDKPVKVLAVTVWYAGAEGFMWLRLGDQRIGVVSTPTAPQLIVLGHPVTCRLASLIRPKLARDEESGLSEVRRVQFWVEK
jgi:hypothetical protein